MNKKVYQTPCVKVKRISHPILCLSSMKTSMAEEGETPTGGWNEAQSQGHRSIWDNMN